MKSERIGQSAAKPRIGEGSETIPAGSSCKSEAAWAERSRYSPSYTERRREIAVTNDDTVFSGNIYSADASTTLIEAYAVYNENDLEQSRLYLADSDYPVEGYTPEGKYVLRGTLWSVGSERNDLWARSGNGVTYYGAQDTSYRPTSGSGESTHYKLNAQGYTYSAQRDDNTWYKRSSSTFVPIDSDDKKTVYTYSHIPNGSRLASTSYSNCYEKNASGGVGTQLYKRDTTKDVTIHQRKENKYPGTLYYRDQSRDQQKRFAISRLTFNPATISTQRLTMLTT